jgi:hypothetical protein
MNKFLLLVVLGVLYISSGVLSATISDPSSNLNYVDSQQLATMNAELTAKLNVLEKKMDSYATKQDITSLLVQHLQKVNEIMANFQSGMIIGFVIVGVALLGVGYAVFFFFKAKGRL